VEEEMSTGKAEMKSTISTIQEKVEAAVHSFWLEETIRHQVEDIL
jgi:hypothetical protein